MPNYYTTIITGYADPELFGNVYGRTENTKIAHDPNVLDIVKPCPDRRMTREVWGVSWCSMTSARYLDGDNCPVMFNLTSAWTAPSNECLELLVKWLAETVGLESATIIGLDPRDGSAKVLYPVPVVALEAQNSPWQPISTAPKDGSPVFLARKGTKSDRGRFLQHMEDRYGKGWVNSHGNLCKPTHWMPIPDLPETQEASNGAS